MATSLVSPLSLKQQQCPWKTRVTQMVSHSFCWDVILVSILTVGSHFLPLRLARLISVGFLHVHERTQCPWKNVP